MGSKNGKGKVPGQKCISPWRVFLALLKKESLMHCSANDTALFREKQQSILLFCRNRLPWQPEPLTLHGLQLICLNILLCYIQLFGIFVTQYLIVKSKPPSYVEGVLTCERICGLKTSFRHTAPQTSLCFNS